MKKIFLLVILLGCRLLNAQYIFQHNYGDLRNERCQSAHELVHGGYLLNCVTTSYGTGDVDAMIIKTDATGNIIWSKSCGNSANEITTFAAETFDGNMVFTGTTDELSSSDVLLLKTDSAGGVLWAKTFGGTALEAATKITEMADHGYVIVGTTESYGTGLSDIFIIRTDVNGDTLYTRIYGSTDSESGKSMSVTSDGGFIICGKSTATNGTDVVIQAILIRTDSMGNLLWSKLYGDTLFQEAQSVLETPDGGFIVCGSRDFTPNGNYDILLFKTDSMGDIQWSKTYGGNKGEGSYAIHQTEDGDFVVSGYTNSMGVGHSLRGFDNSMPVHSELFRRPVGGANYMLGDDSTNIFLMKTDEFGDTLWTRSYGDSLQEEAFLSERTSDGGYLLAGFSDYHNVDSTQALVIKTDADGYSNCYSQVSHPNIVTDLMAQFNTNYVQSSGMATSSVSLTSTLRSVYDSTYCLMPVTTNEISQEESIRFWPNPVNERLFVQLENENSYSVAIYNMLGAELLRTKISGADRNEIGVSQFEQGVYFIIFSDGRQATIRKFIKSN